MHETCIFWFQSLQSNFILQLQRDCPVLKRLESFFFLTTITSSHVLRRDVMFRKTMIPSGLITCLLLQKIVCLKGDSKGIFKCLFPSSHICFGIMNPTKPWCIVRLLKYMLLLQLRYEVRDTCLGTAAAPCSDVPAISMQALDPDFLVYLAVHYLRPPCQNRLNILWETWSQLWDTTNMFNTERLAW